MIRRSAAVATILALAFVSGPVTLGDIFTSRDTGRLAPPSQRPLEPRESRTAWPGGSVEERWHSADELSLYVWLGGNEVEVRYRRTGGGLDAWVIIGDERSIIDLDNLRGALPGARDHSGKVDPVIPGGLLSFRNRETLDWIAEATQGSPLALAEEDERHMGLVIAKAEQSGLQKDSCAEHAGVGLRSTSLWLICTSAVATAGTSLLPCFLLGAGAYLHSFQMLEACWGTGGHSLRLCNCTGAAPDCMCCPGIGDGDDCTCYCTPGREEECCSWPDAKTRAARLAIQVRP